MRHVPSRKAAEILGMHPNTLRKYADNGLIPHFRNPAGQRLYDVETYLERFQPASVVCYCRVSSNDQRDDLERQARWMRERYPDGEIVKDVGGERNWKRKGLVSILERLHRGDKIKIVVDYRDSLARSGFELIEWMAKQNGGEVVVLSKVDASPEASVGSSAIG